MYIIQAYYKNRVMLPCVYSFLTGKDTNDYRNMLNTIKEAALENSLHLNPTYIFKHAEPLRYRICPNK